MKRFLTIRVFQVNMHPSQRPGNTKRREGDATSMIQPLQSQDLRPQTVIIRKGFLGASHALRWPALSPREEQPGPARTGTSNGERWGQKRLSLPLGVECACHLLGSHAGGASHTFSGEVCKQKTFPETLVRQEAETLVNLSNSFTSCV